MPERQPDCLTVSEMRAEMWLWLINRPFFIHCFPSIGKLGEGRAGVTVQIAGNSGFLAFWRLWQLQERKQGLTDCTR